MDQNLPPLPDGFELVQDAPAPQASAQTSAPPPPPGFELVPHGDGAPLEINVSGGTRGEAPTVEELDALRRKTAKPNLANNSAFASMASGSPAKAQSPENSLFRMDSDFQNQSGAGAGNMLVAAMRDMFAGHESAANYLAEKAGGHMVKDANGDPLVALPNGHTYRVNDPGLDSTDAANVAGNVAAYFLPASWAARVGQARNLGLASRIGLQGLTAGATDAGLQAAVTGGDVDSSRVLASAAGCQRRFKSDPLSFESPK
ncbi:hypothetical protein [Xanthomonas albilineans]|uniref:hypothetical protein n=1 Tax=Xanthomonas albilineans TaxID=29447 RepID=UPI000ADC7EB4|nr:hypothetical protein [Xanthomonas albilineans]